MANADSNISPVSEEIIEQLKSIDRRINDDTTVQV
jgi:hypothetical protein